MRVPRGVIAALLVLAAGLAAAALVLASQNTRIRALNADFRASQQVATGLRLPALSGNTAAGAAISYRYGAGVRPTLLLAFDPDCGQCMVNAPQWRRLLAAIDRRRVRVVAVALDTGAFSGTGLSREVLPAIGLGGFQPALLPSGDTVFLYRLRLTPQTILVGAQGRIRGVWSGLRTPADLKHIPALAARLSRPAAAARVASQQGDLAVSERR